jgi:hypothetical protein
MIMIIVGVSHSLIGGGVSPAGETKLIITHYSLSEEGHFKPITAKAGHAQTNGGLIQLKRDPRQTAALHL